MNLKKGVFCPYVPMKSIRSLLNSGEKTLEIGRDDTGNLFDEETQFALNFAGEIGIEGDFESIEEVLRILQISENILLYN